MQRKHTVPLFVFMLLLLATLACRDLDQSQGSVSTDPCEAAMQHFEVSPSDGTALAVRHACAGRLP